MAHEFCSMKMLPGCEVRYNCEYLHQQYGDKAHQKELYFLRGIVLGLKQIGMSSQRHANVAWDNGLTYQVPIEYLEYVNAEKSKVSA